MIHLPDVIKRYSTFKENHEAHPLTENVYILHDISLIEFNDTFAFTYFVRGVQTIQ